MPSKKVYPWSHLVSQVPEDNDEGGFVDIMDAKQSQQSLKKVQSTLAETQTNFNSLEEISAKTVDELEEQVNQLQAQLKQVQEEAKAAQEQLQQQVSTAAQVNYNELIMCILTQAVIAHSRGLDAKDTKRRTLKGVYSWLKQRQRIMDYIVAENMNPELHDQVNALLQLDKDTIVNHIDSVLGVQQASTQPSIRSTQAPPASIRSNQAPPASIRSIRSTQAPPASIRSTQT
uniref:Uncharacterized protein n=1 Tax=viral metagenome TaxID=1070528 RepID=A0A6C0BNN8_9ZZZZ